MTAVRLVEVVEFAALLCLRASDPSGEKVLVLFVMNESELSVPQCPTHSPAGNGDVS
jgi:hypothetical protein